MSSRRPPVMAENEKLSKGAIRKLSAYCRKYMAVIILALILACAGAIFNVMGPDKLSDMTNIIVEGIMTGIDMGEFENIAFFLLTIYILGFVFNYIQGFIMSTVTQRVSRSLRSDISDKINRLPLKYFDSTSFGNVLSRVTNDVDMIAQT